MPDTNSKGDPGNVNLETHPLVAKLHADPDELTELVALVGYLGPSKRAGCVRLYADLSFRNYYEIPTEGVLSTTPADAEDENSPTTVHVAGDTQVEKVSITSQSTEARFLQGSIASDYLGTAGVGAGAGCSWPPSPTCWCVTANNCQQGAAQAGAQLAAPSMVYSCWCTITQHGCEQQAAQPYTDTVYHTCGCSLGSYTCNNCGQAGAQANAQPWPASPTCWCNITRNCNQQAAAPGKAGAWPVTGACHYTQWQACGQAGAQANAQYYWTMGATCACATSIQCHTSQGCA
jgi:hypothetical protein